MTKQVISIRLSKEQIDTLHMVCARLGVTRSKAIAMAIGLLPELVSNDRKVIDRDTYLRTPWMEDDDKD